MFRNDYSETCAPQVLEALAACGMQQNVGYGLDDHSRRAARLILESFGLGEDEAEVHFLAGGTQTNMVVLSYFLRPYDGVIACGTAHINGHETGAVEASGHKVLPCADDDGKLTPAEIEKKCALLTSEHTVRPRAVYISDSTESGTVYTPDELVALREMCDRLGLILFMDGARLGAAVCSRPDRAEYAALIGRVCDAFYVGGTKNGALFGEAVVIKKKHSDGCFRYHIKNRGAMLAKGFVCGIQFERLFEDGLYFELAAHANEMADVLRGGLGRLGITMVGTSPTNQVFIRMKREEAKRVTERYGAELWEDFGGEQVIRLVTSFATRREDCDELVEYFAGLCAGK